MAGLDPATNSTDMRLGAIANERTGNSLFDRIASGTGGNFRIVRCGVWFSGVERLGSPMPTHLRNTYIPCKIGTMPGLAKVHGGDRIEPEKCIRIKEREGDKWHRVYVTGVQVVDCIIQYFTADR